MKVFALSDLHLSTTTNKPMDVFGGAWVGYLPEIEKNWNAVVGEDDVVIVAGDISWAMKLEDAKVDFNFFNKLNGKKIIIKGNHDYWWSSLTALRQVLPENVYALQNDALKIGNFVFCGSRGWVAPGNHADKEVKQDEKLYAREVQRLKLSLNHAKTLLQPQDTLIAITHFPPYNLFDGKDTAVTNVLEEYGVQKVVFGHLHNFDATSILTTEKNGIEYFLTSCDLINNNPVLIA